MLAHITPTATVINNDGEAYVKLADLEQVIRQASPQGQYEMFQEGYLYAFVKQARLVAEGHEPQSIAVHVR